MKKIEKHAENVINSDKNSKNNLTSGEFKSKGHCEVHRFAKNTKKKSNEVSEKKLFIKLENCMHTMSDLGPLW